MMSVYAEGEGSVYMVRFGGKLNRVSIYYIFFYK